MESSIYRLKKDFKSEDWMAEGNKELRETVKKTVEEFATVIGKGIEAPIYGVLFKRIKGQLTDLEARIKGVNGGSSGSGAASASATSNVAAGSKTIIDGDKAVVVN